jgi:hypothetical protein
MPAGSGEGPGDALAKLARALLNTDQMTGHKFVNAGTVFSLERCFVNQNVKGAL